jgi:hypothetical protein
MAKKQPMKNWKKGQGDGEGSPSGYEGGGRAKKGCYGAPFIMKSSFFHALSNFLIISYKSLIL